MKDREMKSLGNIVLVLFSPNTTRQVHGSWVKGELNAVSQAELRRAKLSRWARQAMLNPSSTRTNQAGPSRTKPRQLG